MDDDRTILITQDSDVTVQLGGGASAAATGNILRNADEEIKLSITGNSVNVSLDSAPGAEPELIPVNELYALGETLGGGGQGIVFAANDPGLQREVAVKQLRAELNDSAHARQEFIHEARLTAALDHPAIIPIYNLCTDEKGGLSLAMK